MNHRLAKGSSEDARAELVLCPLCGLAAILAVLSGACDNVPMLSFGGEGGVDDDSGAILPDASARGGDGSGAQTPDDASVVEASDDAECPDRVPAGASLCCGSVACNGNCTSNQCSVCEMQCGTVTLCCAKTNNVSCRPLGAPCP